MKCGKMQKPFAFFVATTLLYTGRAARGCACEVLRAFTVVRVYAAMDATVAQWFFTLYPKDAFFQVYLNSSTVLRTALKKTNAVAETGFSEPVPTTTRVLFLFHGTGYVKIYLQNCFLYEKLLWTTIARTEADVQLAIETRAALYKST